MNTIKNKNLETPELENTPFAVEKTALAHNPPHKYSLKGTYMITSSTLHKKHLFNTPEKLSLLQNILFEKAQRYQWSLKAWAIFSNHYHIIAESEDDPESLPAFVGAVHSASALGINRMDDTAGRQVWYQYWDTHLTYHKSYFARLHYVIENPVKHGLVPVASQYEWCSAAWFERYADHEFKKMIRRFKVDKVNVLDDF